MEIWNMHSIRNRLSIPVQIFLLIFYIALVLFIKNMYDAHQKNLRFEKYNEILQDVVGTLEEVEKQARKSINYFGIIDNVNNIKEEVKYIKTVLHLTQSTPSKPPTP